MLEIDGLQVVHEINPRMKHANLRVDPDGVIILRSGPRVAREDLERFVRAKREWIEQQRSCEAAKPKIVLGETLLWMGTLVSAAEFELCGEEEAAALRRRYDRFYREAAQAHIPPKTAVWSQRMGLHPEGIRFRKMKRQWGSCSSAQILTFNTLLVQLPPPLIDYIVVHELAHLAHFNHSKAFHALVRAHLPDEHARRQQMRAHTGVHY